MLITVTHIIRHGAPDEMRESRDVHPDHVWEVLPRGALFRVKLGPRGAQLWLSAEDAAKLGSPLAKAALAKEAAPKPRKRARKVKD